MADNFDFGAMLDAQFKAMKKKRRESEPQLASEDNAQIKKAFEEGEAISGLVEKEIKGGFEVTIAGQRTFCPFSQIDKFKKESEEYLGRKFDFLVTDYSIDERGLNVVVSRRALIELEAEALKEALLNELSEGETLNGTVTRVMPFGAFVDLGGIEGLVPAREVAWERVDDLNTVLKSGDAITVKILRIDREEGKLTLSRKECMSRVFKKSAEEEAAAKSAAEVSAWMKDNEKRNAAFGCGAFDSL